MFGEVLERRAKAFSLAERLAKLHPERALVETESGYFNVQTFADAGHCTLVPRADLFNQFETSWRGPDDLRTDPKNAWLDVTWNGHTLTVIKLTWDAQYGESHHFAMLGASREICLELLDAVCKWNHEVRGEILVYSEGCFHKDPKLFDAIAQASFEQLVLAGSLKDQIKDDFTQFLTAREAYDEHGIPWKRGALFVGPPGNGKTLCVKALVRLLKVPCIYVQSFKAQYTALAQAISEVFTRARETAPCVIVLEDIDSLIPEEGRSFFHNELDGFASNTGVITLATTNHAEKLDPSIMQRPSRFDRKYHFLLPDAATRADYIAMWNARLRPALRLDDLGRAKLAAQTDGFSFAYIQEVFASSMMRWMATQDPRGLLPVALAQLEELRAQMTTT